MRVLGPAREPVCWTLAGFASGFSSALMGENVRELQNAVESAVVLSADRIKIERDDLPPEVRGIAGPAGARDRRRIYFSGSKFMKDVERAVRERYSEAAERRVEALCCPTQYDPKLLEAIPEEVLERDYGCGDPSRWLQPGDTVVDLGSGSGKICFIASQVVGASGRVIGIDMNDDMLQLARRAAPRVAERLGYRNVEFRKAKIEDLSGVVDEASVDVVVSNCVLNLVAQEAKQRLFREIHRILRPGGRAVISDITSDETVPASMQEDPDLWSGCIAGALREDRFLRAFIEAGLAEPTVLERQEEPWQIVDGIEFRSVTVRAQKGEATRGCC